MKTALLISGHTRDFETNLQHLVNFKNQFDADVFISSYNERGTGIRFWRKQTSQQDYLIEKDYNLIHSSLLPIQFDYNDIELDKKFNINCNFRNRIVSTSNAYKMFYKIKQCNLYKQNYENQLGFKYDLVIRLRFDTIIKNFNLITPNLLTTARADNQNYITDTFFASSSSNMDIICNVLEYYIELSNTNLYSFENAESVLTSWVKQNNINFSLEGNIIHLRDKIFS